MKHKYPVYIVSKGRYKNPLTAFLMEKIGADYRVIVEPDEVHLYEETLGADNLLVMDKRFEEEYETLDDLGDSKSKGPGPARNFAWHHSIERGFSRHWVMDDNIRDFYRLHQNDRLRANHINVLKLMEDFVDRYTNVGMAGPAYYSLAIPTSKHKPFRLNTHIYSCNLIRNDLPFRWRGRYNEDTDLSIMILKHGLCTIEFLAFLQDKLTTQTMKGGNTDNFYEREGTYLKSKMLADTHPDLCRLVKRYNRWHHYCDYRKFKKRKLIRRKDFQPKGEVNNYGLRLKRFE